MKSDHTASNLLTVLLLALSIFLTFGTQFLFHACNVKEDGSYMLCHWAQRAVTGTGAVLIILYILCMIAKDRKIKAAFITAGIPVTILAMLFPDVLISMCMSDTMRCQAVMRPAVLAVGCAILIITAVSLPVNLRRKR